MDHYIDITLRADPEFKPAMLMGALFNKLHRILAQLQSNRIAVSFPFYRDKGKTKGLGDVLRLHGDRANLDNLMTNNWLSGMSDHIDKTAMLPVPAEHEYRQVKRVQCKSNVERLRARYMSRHDVTREAAINALPDTVEQKLHFPFVMVNSSSTGQQFRLFIRQDKVAQPLPDSTFNCYGLGLSGTVPWF